MAKYTVYGKDDHDRKIIKWESYFDVVTLEIANETKFSKGMGKIKNDKI